MIINMIKLSAEWKFIELFAQHNYIKNLHDIHGDEFDKKRLKISTEKIVKYYKKIYKKTLIEKDLLSLNNKIKDLFYKKKFLDPEFGEIPLLGPIGQMRLSHDFFLDLDDIKEVYVDSEDISGSIKTETCGWISWKIKKGDKNMFKHLTSKYIVLTSMNHFKQETSLEELWEKNRRYDNPDSTMGRHLKRFFVSNRFWFHDDLEKLFKSLRYFRLNEYK